MFVYVVLYVYKYILYVMYVYASGAKTCGELCFVHAKKKARLKLRKPTTSNASALIDIVFKIPSLQHKREKDMIRRASSCLNVILLLIQSRGNVEANKDSS